MRKAAAASLPALLFAAGLALLATGWLSRADFAELAGRALPILLFVAAMTVVTELADRAGLFRVLTAWLARRAAHSGPPSVESATARGRVWVLWLLVVALATVSTVFLSLDTTAVLVTPVVVSLAVHAKIRPMPFALTTVWLANTASLLLPVSNLTNLLAQHQLNMTPLGFAGLLWAPALVGVVVPVAFLAMIFRPDLRGSYPAPDPPAAGDKPLLILSGVTVALLLPALVSGITVAIPATIAALFLVVVFVVRNRGAVRWGIIPLQPLLLAMGLFMVVQALDSHGMAAALGSVSGSGDGFPALLQLAGVGALSANAVNNLPAYLALESTANSPVRLAALLIGVNLGPLVSPWASLATLLWAGRLKALGLHISWAGYALAGLVLVVVLLPLSVLALWLTVGLPG